MPSSECIVEPFMFDAEIPVEPVKKQLSEK